MERCNTWQGNRRCIRPIGHTNDHAYEAVDLDFDQHVASFTVEKETEQGYVPAGTVELAITQITPSGYVEAAMRTDPSDLRYEAIEERLQNRATVKLLHAGMGLCTEAGEFVDQLKRHIFYGKDLDITNLAEEVGDIFWYSALAISNCNTTAEKVMAANIAKLFKRYTEQFEEVSALVRDILKENEALEEHL